MKLQTSKKTRRSKGKRVAKAAPSTPAASDSQQSPASATKTAATKTGAAKFKNLSWQRATLLVVGLAGVVYVGALWLRGFEPNLAKNAETTAPLESQLDQFNSQAGQVELPSDPDADLDTDTDDAPILQQRPSLPTVAETPADSENSSDALLLQALAEQFDKVVTNQGGLIETDKTILKVIEKINTQIAEINNQIGEIVAIQTKLIERQQQFAAQLPEIALAQQQATELSTQLTATQQRLVTQLQEFRQNLADAETSAQADREAQSAQLEQHAAALAVIDSYTSTKWRRILGVSAELWLLEEVEASLVDADLRMKTAGDVEFARARLAYAVERLRAIENPKAQTLRLRISNDIDALDALPEVDIAATMSALTRLTENAAELPLRGDAAFSEPQSVASAPPPTSTWEEFFADLGSLVEVQRADKPVTPILSAELRWLILARLQLMLESCQVAVLRGDAAIYATRMQDVRRYVAENYNLEAKSVTLWLQTWAQLVGVPVRARMDFSGSISALRALTASYATSE